MSAAGGDVLVVGAGLIGASIGLALQGHRRVVLWDRDPERVREAVGRGAGDAWDGTSRVELAVVAVPPAHTASLLVDLLRRDVAAHLTHVASSQARVQHDLEAYAAELSRICGGHPLAGREVTGPAGATASLFSGRPWVACPLPGTSAEARAAVLGLAEDCGAEAVVMSPEAHDRAVALSSHLPQLAASALAARLLDGDAETVRVSGPGLQDTTRIAASDAELWTDVLSANAAQVAPLAALLAADLQRVAEALAALAEQPGAPDDLDALHDLLVRGNVGRALVPVKRGLLDGDVAVVAVRVPDRPGALADLLTRAAAAEVNVEDIRVEHLAGRQTGVVELLVRSAHRPALVAALGVGGLQVIAP
ncbi:MAG: prephenate dehydrogenase [Actinomycetota bacterium]|nr:prephenate dehydrogenase [Actinomycetota bacterium]